MLYLAEVIRKARVIGGSKAEFRLLSCQKTELSWSAVPGDEIIPASEDVNYGAGVLVLLDLSAAKQIQRHTEAGRQLVSILQNFSRIQEKSKNQEEEIEQWKQSLTYQSQELNRREMEMEARQEQLDHLEEDFEKLEQQRQEIAATQEDLNRLREEYERKSQELEGAWAQLRGAENQLEERQTELQQISVLDARQAEQIQALLARISSEVTPIESIHQPLHTSFELIAQQQEVLGHHWHNLEQHRNSAQQLQAESDRQTQNLSERWQAWHQDYNALIQARLDLQSKQDALRLKQQYAQTLTLQRQTQDTLYQQLAQLTGGFDKTSFDALETMPLDELQTTVKELENDLAKLSRFVHSQEEELNSQQEEIDNLQKQFQQASEYDRLRLETELADEQDRYQMLNQTLVGQRRNLLERQTVLKQHQNALSRRQGYPISEEGNAVDLAPVLAQVEQVRQQLTQELQHLEPEIQDLQQAIQTLQVSTETETNRLDAQRNELHQIEQQVRSQIAAVAELWGRVNLYQDALQPIQDHLNGLKHQTEAIANIVTQFQATNGQQLQAVSEMQATIQQLTNVQMQDRMHELAVS